MRLRLNAGAVWPRDYVPDHPTADLVALFDRQKYRLDDVSTRRFKSMAGAAYTGGAGFKMARTKGGVWLPVAANEPGETDAGLGVWDARTNKSTNFNAKPTDLTGVSKSGEAAATLTLVDDTAALRAAGFGRLIDDGQMNGQVYKLDNSLGGSVSFVTFTGFTGNTNRHTGVIYLRGTGVGSQLRSSGGGAEGLTNYSLLPSYARVAVDLNALAGSRQLQLWVAAGSVVYFILNELKEGADINDPPIVTTGLPATRTADSPVCGGLGDLLTQPFLVIADVEVGPPAGSERIVALQGATAGDRATLIRASTGALVLGFVNSSGGSTTNVSIRSNGAYPGAARIRAAFGWTGAGWIGAADGEDAQGSAAALPTLERAHLGYDAGGGNRLNGVMRQFQIMSLTPTPALVKAVSVWP